MHTPGMQSDLQYTLLCTGVTIQAACLVLTAQCPPHPALPPMVGAAPLQASSNRKHHLLLGVCLLHCRHRCSLLRDLGLC